MYVYAYMYICIGIRFEGFILGLEFFLFGNLVTLLFHKEATKTLKNFVLKT